MARASKYKPEFCTTLRDEMGRGLSFEACAGVMGVNRDTLYTWTEKYPDFKQAKSEALALNQLFWETKARDNLVIGDGVSKFNSTVWIFTMKNLHGWRDKRDVALSGGVGLTHVFAQLSPAQVEQRLDELLARMPAEALQRALGKKK